MLLSVKTVFLYVVDRVGFRVACQLLVFSTELASSGRCRQPERSKKTNCRRASGLNPDIVLFVA
jgi:hypothetical protein